MKNFLKVGRCRVFNQKFTNFRLLQTCDIFS